MNEVELIETHDIVIKLRYDNEVIVKECEGWGRLKDCDPFFYVKHRGLYTYIPIAQVVYIGPKDHMQPQY